MQAALDCKPHEMMKKIFTNRGLQSNKYGMFVVLGPCTAYR